MMARVVEQRFRGTIGGGEGDGSTAFLEVPAEVVAALSEKKRPPVRVTINGHSYRSTIAIYGDKAYVPVRREVREAAGVRHGSEFDVVIELDDAPRVVEVPADLTAGLTSAPTAQSLFESLSYSHRREYADWIKSAKRAETRQRRVSQAIEMLSSGRRTPKAP